MLTALPSLILATHNRAGEITFRSIGDPEDYTYQIIVTTYTDAGSPAAHREEIEIFFGHGNPEVSEIVSASIQREPVPKAPSIWRNQYQVIHRFPGPGECYIVSFTDPNRVSSILNINDSNSVNIPFYIQSEICIYDATGEPANNGPELLERPLSFACVGQRYEHNPNAFDIDGDSLSYELVVPMMEKNKPVSNYTSPQDVRGNEGSFFNLDAATGELVWDAPLRPGVYNIAFRITEWRKVITPGGPIMRRMGYVTRDMQVFVVKCNNEPPVIAEIRDTCVVAGSGTPLTFRVRATDPNNPDPILLTASGGPFELDNQPARSWTGILGNSPVNGTFFWDIDCSHIRQQPYSVVFNATDDGNGFPGQELTDLELVNITVVGPQPKNLNATPGGNTIYLDWQAPNCDGVVSYIVYRKSQASGWDPDACEIGVPGYTGFRQIAIVKPDELSFADDRGGNGLFHGLRYCYRVTALYKVEGQFAQSEGIASNEICAELKRDVPIIIQSTVDTTDVADGETTVKWAPPIELDTQTYMAPYRFLLREQIGIEELDPRPDPLLTNTYSSYYDITQDSINKSVALNTLENQYSYSIEFFATDPVSGEELLVGNAKAASTPWLNIKPNDKKLLLVVETDVPWKNDSFVFYRLNKRTGEFNYIGNSTTGEYLDSGLTNGREYCYKVQTFGGFATYPEYNPVINWSQETCARPRDLIPPCSPELTARADCDAFENRLQWTFEDDDCSFDVVKYYILFQELGKGPFVLVDSVEGSNRLLTYNDTRETLQRNLAGCYRIIAIDSFDNRSDSSNIVCVDNCPRYIIPNIITPNADDLNDILVPLNNYRFVESVSITIYNRWGQEVYTSNDIAINWDGTDQRSGNVLSPGTYFYVCDITYIRLRENENRTFSGTVQVTR